MVSLEELLTSRLDIFFNRFNDFFLIVDMLHFLDLLSSKESRPKMTEIFL
jgi:hypothetical protein